MTVNLCRRIAAMLCALLLICASADAASVCAHTNYWIDENVYENETWIPHSDRMCYKYADCYAEYRCNDCGAMFDRQLIGLQMHVDGVGHGYENGACSRCGYVNKCTHEDTFAWQQKHSTDAVLSSDTDSHTKTVNVFDLEVCLDCDERLKEDDLGTITVREKHSFSGDTCTVCEYQRTTPCLHEYCWEREIFRNEHYEINPRQHIRTGDLYRIVECSECWQTVSGELIEANAVRTENHIFDPTGMGLDVCSYCEYKPSCAHPSTTVVENIYDIGGYGVDPVSPTLHKTGVYISNREICDDCGVIVTLDYVDDWSQVFEPHTFLHGECTECGYRDVCLHENLTTKTSEETTVRPISGAEHAVVTQNIETDVCAYCGKKADERIAVGVVERTETHAFTDGECTLCDFAEHADVTLELPADAKVIAAEAFMSTDARFVVLPDGCESIGARAFADNPLLTSAYMPDSVTDIAANAFEGSENVIIICESDNFAADYARTHAIPFTIG